MVALSGGLNLIGIGIAAFAALVVAAAGYFTFWSDEIKVTTDGISTLTDFMWTLWEAMKTMMDSRESVFGDLFKAEGAQKAFDVIKGLLETLNRICHFCEIRSVCCMASI